MIRRAFSALALTAVLAAPAVAQTPFTANFTFGAGNAGSVTYDQYYGSLNGGSIFQVFCVDPTRFVGNPETYTNAWVTPMSVSNANSIHTQNPGNVWNSRYLEAARIATFMTGPAGVGNLALSDTQVRDYQWAIWSAMGFGGYGSAAVTAIRTAASSIVINPNNWMVVTDGAKVKQEFIAVNPNPPQETVPEPATMTLLATGLAGMAAAKRRRNKKS